MKEKSVLHFILKQGGMAEHNCLCPRLMIMIITIIIVIITYIINALNDATPYEKRAWVGS